MKRCGSKACTRPRGPTSWASGTVWAPRLAPISRIVAPGCTRRWKTRTSSSEYSPYSARDLPIYLSLLGKAMVPCRQRFTSITIFSLNFVGHETVVAVPEPSPQTWHSSHPPLADGRDAYWDTRDYPDGPAANASPAAPAARPTRAHPGRRPDAQAPCPP